MEQKLNEIIISMTNRCNLRCRMCQIPFMGNNEMPASQLIELISDAAMLYPSSIVFSGGEPLLREDIFELISFADKQKINTCLTSNGILINDEVAQQLASSGIGVVNISVEGRENTHDFLRGKGNYKKAIRALECLARHKIETTIASIVCRHNYESLPYVMELAREFGVTTVKFQPFSGIFLIDKDKKKEFFLTPEYLGEVIKSIEAIIGLSRKYKISTNSDNYLYNIPGYLCGLSGNNVVYQCPALWTSCPIAHDGNVYLCWVTSDNPIGNVRKNKLSEIWNSQKHRQLREAMAHQGCSGCLMSCYDYNMGKNNMSQALLLKAGKFKDTGFYKRFYYRIYQNAKYLLSKAINKIQDLGIFHQKRSSVPGDKIEEIKLVKQTLKKKIKLLEQDEKG